MAITELPIVSRVAVFGDVQGHAEVYERALRILGVDTDEGTIPDGLTIVQAGDLIHKGPDSAGTVRLANRMLQQSPEQYVQLVGNHEGQYIGGPDFWPGTVDEQTAITLAQWFVDEAMAIAHAITPNLLVSHGGMSRTKWVSIGEPASALDAAGALNAEFFADPASALQAGRMLRGEPGPPGVAWTEPALELYEPWLRHGEPPFSQIHGHASPYHWASGRWYGGVPRRQKKLLRLNPTNRQTELTVGGATFFGVDTAFGEHEPNAVITPLVIGFDRLGQQAVELGP